MKPSPWTCSVEAGNGNHTRFSKSQALAGGSGVALRALSLPSATTQRAQPLGRGLRRELGLVLMVLETPSHLLPAAAGTGLATVHGLSWVLSEGVLTDTVEKPAVECDLRRGRPAGQGAPQQKARCGSAPRPALVTVVGGCGGSSGLCRMPTGQLYAAASSLQGPLPPCEVGLLGCSLDSPRVSPGDVWRWPVSVPPPPHTGHAGDGKEDGRAA